MLKRRKFITTAIGFSASSMLPTSLFAQKDHKISNSALLPKRLKKGDTIGLIAPGYAVAPEVLEKMKQTLINMGFIPYHTERIVGNQGYFSNTDEERAVDLNEMFSNPNVNGILCARGGYGCTRIMHLINYENIKQHPKVFIGFSDITALLNGIYTETGMITFHGPVGSTLDDPYSISQLKRVVGTPKKKLLIKNADFNANSLLTNSEFERYTITPGEAVGKLVGGSLTLINALIGTAHEIDFTNTIVCIEDVEESPYRIDRMLTQLIEGKTFHKASGIVFGVCKGCDKPKRLNSFTLKEVIMDRVQPLQIPAVYGMSFGHIQNNFTFPIGIDAKLSTTQMTLQLQAKAVL
ncbi:MAG: LD-carboxypeptidase [Flavobacteriaceae bacterium]|nr:MAG: LD-carboxypeptidase [Flavobacteriaceae bacterium]